MDALRRIKVSQIPAVRNAILHKRQGGKCAICEASVSVGCLDHNHTTGLIRGVLCNSCNGIEGKIKNLVTRGRRWHSHENYLGQVLKYWMHHMTDRTNLYHPVHLTDDEKRLKRNAKARKTRAKKKKAGA